MNLAHGVGGAQDLPIPASYAVTGAGIALLVSFAILAIAWRRPRFNAAHHGTELPPGVTAVIRSRWATVGLRTIGMAMFAYVMWIAIWGPDLLTNPIFRSEEHTSELQSLMRISYAVFCLKKKK